MSASQPYIGEIAMFAGSFAPTGWALCNGQLLSIADNSALFTIIGTTYGGNGQTTFALPDLRSRAPVHAGQGPGLSNRIQGEMAGTETTAITLNQLPAHSHAVTLNASTGPANTSSPASAAMAVADDALYASAAPGATLSANSLALGNNPGGGQPHDNTQPYLTINFIISLYGVFPSQN